MDMQRFLAYFLCAVLGFTNVATIALFFLQGFHLWGFQLDNSLMHWIGGATIGTIGAQAATVYGAFFKKR